MVITYAITCKDEHGELERLLRFLKENIRQEDQVLIQLDSTYTTEVLEVCNLFTNFNHSSFIENQAIPNSKFIVFPLNNDFASFKNNLAKHAEGEYIFQIDADELPTVFMVKNLSVVLETNPEVDVYLVPRENYVNGITSEHTIKWGWLLDSKNRINYPDMQWRIYKNDSFIHWVNKVHERLAGYKKYSYLPPQEEWSLNHTKTIEKQEKQNKFYENI
jgi:glycosyltransferase involved in cell wall biosynthesis